jgi:ADP-ribosyl-[dinitrogen reductase] hydrolase
MPSLRLSKVTGAVQLQVTHLERCAGALLGLACGDAVGTTVEFQPRGSFRPVTDMVGGGPFGLTAGLWTDDTSMALCLAESLLSKNGCDVVDQMARYLNWWHWGYLSSTGRCFDIGMTVKSALQRFQQTHDPYAGDDDPYSAGNGALMRLAPVVLYYYPDKVASLQYAVQSTLTTHAAPEAIDCSRLLAYVLMRGLDGASQGEMLDASDLKLASPKVAALARGSYFAKDEAEVFGTGYAVASLEAALWCFKTTHSFEEAVLCAANLGDDADTTAAIVGQIAGVHYGLESIPKAWRDRLHLGVEIEAMAYRLGASKNV